MECTRGNFNEQISDHMPNFIILESLDYSSDRKGEIIVRDMIKFNDNNFLNEINIDN